VSLEFTEQDFKLILIASIFSLVLGLQGDKHDNEETIQIVREVLTSAMTQIVLNEEAKRGYMDLLEMTEQYIAGFCQVDEEPTQPEEILEARQRFERLID